MGFGERVAAKADDAVITKARDSASVAARFGHVVYAPVLDLPGGPLSIGLALNRWGMVIAAIEAEGWRLEAWAADSGHAYPLFRRAAGS